MIKVLVAGDFCPHHRVAELLSKGDCSFFEGVKARIGEADYAVVNFECPVVEGEVQAIEKCGPALKTTARAVEAITAGGFDAVTLANNHFRDYGDVGCRTTLDVLKSAGLDIVGGGMNLSEAQQILYKTVRDKRLAIVNFCENEFSIATTTQAGAAPLDLIDNIRQIREARENADYVLVIVHGGHEHYQLPSPRMKKLYRFFVECGADAVVNHHQHCYSGYEVYQGHPIVYGLGNFCFDWEGQRSSTWNEGYCVELQFEEGRVGIKLLPYTQCDESPIVEWRQPKQITSFEKHIEKLNHIISEDMLLQEAFGQWVEKQQKIKMNIFASYHNRYLNAAAYRGWIPRLITKSELGAIINHIECESHRDVTLAVLKK